MNTKRPTKRLNDMQQDESRRSGKAQIVETQEQFQKILTHCSMGKNGTRNVAIIWMLFGSGLRINEIAQLKVRDVFYSSEDLKKSFVLPGSYTKTGKPRIIYILATDHREALEVKPKQH